jgi:hypothetical protein
VYALVITTVATALYVNAGSLTPPAGPVAPTMKTLDQLSSEIAAVSAGGIKRVVRGVINVAQNQMEETVSFAPSIDPAKSVVTLDEPVATEAVGAIDILYTRNGACVMSLQASQLTIRVDLINSKAPVRVSYQIIEYN